MTDRAGGGRWLSIAVVLLVLAQIALSLAAANYFRLKLKKLGTRLESALPASNPGADRAGIAVNVQRGDAKQLAALAARIESIRTRFALFDAVGGQHKNGLIEVYGGTLRSRHAGPLRLGATELAVTHDRALVLFGPDHSPASGATHVAVSMLGRPGNGRLTVGVTTRDAQTFLFSGRLGPDAPAPQPAPLPPMFPEAVMERIGQASAQASALVSGHGGTLYGVLPAELAIRLDDPQGGLEAFFVLLDGAAGTTIPFARVALVEVDNHRGTPDVVSVSGKVTGAVLPRGAEVELRLESGRIRRQLLAVDDSFRFDDVTSAAPVSLRFHHGGRWYYSALGRWFAPDHSRTDVDIPLAPLFTNPTAAAPDPGKALFVTPREPSRVAAFYEPHARQYWPGASTPQEYDSLTFTNNFGYIDRDRTFDNPDACLRVVHLGSSHAVALQVRPFEKYNIEMESELSVLTQRCVEVLSAGRDNGDVGSNYPRIRDYAQRFAPDAILLENSSSLVMQLHPVLLKQGFGWDHEFNALDNFHHAGDGTLAFREWSPEYALHAVAPALEELTPGVPTFETLRVPLEAMRPIGREAFGYFAEILGYFAAAHPGQRFVVHTGLDQAQCRDCDREATLADGRVVPMGAATFIANHDRICGRHGIECLNPEGARAAIAAGELPTFVNDGHYSVRGHQWLARELSRKLAGLLCGAPPGSGTGDGSCTSPGGRP